MLDIACGNGQFARKMAQLGARVIATDISERMIANAKARTRENADRIEYRVVDATSREQLLALGEDASTRRCALWPSWTWQASTRYSNR